MPLVLGREEWTNLVTSNQFSGPDYKVWQFQITVIEDYLWYHVLVFSPHSLELCCAAWLSPLIEHSPAGCPLCSWRYEYGNFHPKLSCFVLAMSFPMDRRDKELWELNDFQLQAEITKMTLVRSVLLNYYFLICRTWIAHFFVKVQWLI